VLDVCYWASNAIKAGMAIQTEGVDLRFAQVSALS
jgi:hypothetical protein